jgi:predicted ATPase/DNA-binding SARP family transcriptional activator
VLGPVEVVRADGSVVSLPAKQTRLLAALVAARGGARGTDELVEAVWNGSAPASARKLVQVYVSQLRKAGVEVVTRGGAYAFEVQDDELDAIRFERLLAECDSARRGGNAALAASLAERALALWRGRAYGELAYEDFARAEGERLEELQLVALEGRLEAQLALGRHSEVLAEALALAAQSPFRERAHELAMQALYRCGRQKAALEQYAAVRARLRDELGLEPGPALRDLQRRILQQHPDLDVPAETARAAPALPVPPSPLVGRERELDELGALLARRHARLIVLAGAGGSGKTRLALEAARWAAGSFANGARLVELAPIRDPALVVPTIARVLGVVDDAAAEPLEAVAGTLASQELLLVVDNVEHVREAAPSLTQLVARAPRVSLLVTSRAVLHVSGEHVFPVTPLSEDAAAELFFQRARFLDPAFARAAENEDDVREICRRLDCLPLAIELAAARVRALTPRVLRTRLGQRLPLLTGGARDLPARQQTLRATIAWSIDLLDDAERRTLARLSVFPASASLVAVEAVCGADLDMLGTLVDDHLVRRADAGGEPRFGMLETVREYAADLLQADPADLARTRTRHAEWCLALIEEAEPHLSGDRQTEWLDRLESEHDGFRAAFDFLDRSGETELQLRLATLLSRFWYVRGYHVEGRRRLEGVLANAAQRPPTERRRAFTAAAWLALLQGDYGAARGFAEEALEAARASEEPRFVANALSNLGAIVLAAGDYERAESVLEEAVQLARGVGDPRIAALAINNYGDLALTLGDFERAKPLFEQSLALLRTLGDTANIARSLFNNGAVDLMQGRISKAAARFGESLLLAREADDR